MVAQAVANGAYCERAARCLRNEITADRLKLTASAVSSFAAPFIPIPPLATSVCTASINYFVHKICEVQDVYGIFDLPIRKWHHITGGVAFSAGIGAAASLFLPSSIGWGLAVAAFGIHGGHVLTYYDYYFLNIPEEEDLVDEVPAQPVEEAPAVIALERAAPQTDINEK